MLSCHHHHHTTIIGVEMIYDVIVSSSPPHHHTIGVEGNYPAKAAIPRERRAS
jgi:hypothetical protein